MLDTPAPIRRGALDSQEVTLVINFLFAALLAALFAGGSWTHSASHFGSQLHFNASSGNGGGPSGNDGHGGG
jgi:hypothetical protein